MVKNTLENLLKILWAIASFPADIPGAGGRVQFYRHDACSILATVAHFLEEQLECIDAMQGSSVLFLVII
jgi:hypothetical protein